MSTYASILAGSSPPRKKIKIYNGLLLEYIITMNFKILTLYPAILINSLVSSRGFCGGVDFMEFST